MQKGASPAMGVLASAALALLTLTVFARNQFQGPEGGLQRFLMATERRDWEEAARAVRGTQDEFRLVVGFALLFLDRGAKYATVAVLRKGDRATAEVLFLHPILRRTTIWFLVRDGRTWKVDAGRMTLAFVGPGASP